MYNMFYKAAERLNAKIVEKVRPLDGVQFVVTFDNGYGVSVDRSYGTYGYEKGLFELAVIIGTQEDYDLCYDTPITDDVIGWLNEDDVVKYMEEVSKLKISAE